jgi:CRISPR-associated protein Cas5h
VVSQEFVLFDVASDLAHFRRQYAVTTALTYPLPPRTALCGLVGAVLGLPKNEGLLQFTDEEATFGLQILEPIRTGTLSIGLLDTKDSRDFRPKRVNPHTFMRYETVREPRYRVIFGHRKLGEPLAVALEKAETSYTPCLGLAWMIAWLQPVGIMSAQRVDGSKESRSFASAVRTADLGGEIAWDAGAVYQRVRMPAEMQPDRRVTRYEEYIVETTGHSIRATLRSYWELADGTCFSPM